MQPSEIDVSTWPGQREGRLRTLVFCIMRWRGVRVRATRDVEKSISMMVVLPPSLLKLRANGSVW